MAIDNRTNLHKLTLGEAFDMLECLHDALLKAQPTKRMRLEKIAAKLKSANAILLAESSTEAAE